MFKKNIFYICFIVMQISVGQNPTYSLDQCITIALKNNNALKQTQLNAKQLKIQLKQAKNEVLPTLNGYYDYGITNGRSINPATNDYINSELRYSSARLSLGVTVFNGFKLLNTIKQNKLLVKASDFEIKEAKQNLILNVTLVYLQILNTHDVLFQAIQSLKNTEKQLKRVKKRFESGASNPADYADIKGQYALDQTRTVTVKNTLNDVYLQLGNLLNIEHPFSVQTLNTVARVKPYLKSLKEVYATTLNFFPSLKSQVLKVKAFKKDIQVAKADYLPNLSLFAQTGTNYSSAGTALINLGTDKVENGDFVTIEGVDYPVFTTQSTFNETSISYNNQFKNNLNSVVGLQLNIPIFNGFRVKNRIAVEKINLETSKIALNEKRFALKQAIKRAYNAMESAFKRQEILKKQVVAYQESFRVNEIRYNTGVANFLAYVTSKNNSINAQINLANAKYDYLLRVKVLEYYQKEK